MIFVTTGSRKFPFERLIKAADSATAELRLPREEVFAQIGTSPYKPLHMEYTEFLDREAFEEKIERCDFLITHAAVGVIISGLHKRKKIIAVPRLFQYGEVIDDHQTELANALAKQNLLFCIEDLSCLADMMRAICCHKFNDYICVPEKIIAVIEDLIES